MAWYQKSGATWLLRLGGIGVLAIAWLAASALRARVGGAVGALERDALAWLLAMTTFLCGTTGALLTVLGSHIFDRVRLSRRWRRVDRV